VEPAALSNQVILASNGFGEVSVELQSTAPRPEEVGTSAALVRGMLYAMEQRGYRTGGLQGEVRSELPVGGGLSSSAAFTVLIGKIQNTLYNRSEISPRELAECAQQAENLHFGKPSGLMDQMACAMEGTVYMDFLTGEFLPIPCEFGAMGLALCLTDTGGSHAGLTAAYAEIPADMALCATELGENVLGKTEREAFFALHPPHDRAHDRARHFYGENDRVTKMRDAMSAGNRDTCLALMNASGRSSERLLRNITATGGDGRLAEGLAMSEKILNGRGAWRVHGGGFAGCVQALVPLEMLESYRNAMEQAFGAGSCFRVM